MSVIMALGFTTTGSAGIIIAIDVVRTNTAAGIIIWVSSTSSVHFKSPYLCNYAAILWMINCLGIVWILKRVLAAYRSSGVVGYDCCDNQTMV